MTLSSDDSIFAFCKANQEQKVVLDRETLLQRAISDSALAKFIVNMVYPSITILGFIRVGCKDSKQDFIVILYILYDSLYQC